MHMQSILHCTVLTALYVIVNFIVFALEQSTVYRGIGCLLACCVVRSRFSVPLVSPVLSLDCWLHLISSGFQVWITKATECAVYCGYFQSIDFHLGLRLSFGSVRVHIVDECACAYYYYYYYSAFWAHNQQTKSQYSALARHIPFLNLSSSIFLSSRFIIKQLRWSFFNLNSLNLNSRKNRTIQTNEIENVAAKTNASSMGYVINQLAMQTNFG